MIVQKGGQVTKPIIVVKVPCKLLYVIQVKEFLIKCSTSWPYLISEFLVAYITIVASDWPRTFFTPKVFLFSISLLFVREENIMKKSCWRSCHSYYNMIVLSFPSSLCCCCCCYLPIDFHHRSFRKWHMSFKDKAFSTSADSHIPIYNAAYNQYCKFNFEA